MKPACYTVFKYCPLVTRFKLEGQFQYTQCVVCHISILLLVHVDVISKHLMIFSCTNDLMNVCKAVLHSLTCYLIKPSYKLLCS